MLHVADVVDPVPFVYTVEFEPKKKLKVGYRKSNIL